jgi:hypothetical protein
MIICFNCSAETKRALDSLLGSGQYRDYNDAISSAIMNLAVLQKEVLSSGGVIIGGDANADPAIQEEKQIHTAQQAGDRITGPPAVPVIFHLDGLADASPSLADLPDDMWAIGQEIPLERWIFGQHNRLLPAKASCRALARLLLDQPKGVPLEEAAEQIAESAAVLGDFLTHHDEQNNVTRDDALSTAFPSTGEDASKSRLRYANQFVASVNKEGQVSGLPIDLKLINRKGRKTPRLMLTDIGWQFATMPNPILDDLQETLTQKFTEEEKGFLLRHIAQSVPVEDFAYRATLKVILSGSNTPDAVDEALQKQVPAKQALSKSFLSSQRSGAISRMTDLELVERVRDGVRVSYTVTDAGKEYVRMHDNH